ncbi:MAG: hypothetical protein ACLFUB_14785 [Cyclobacteriaceae bacterium]
MKFFSYAALLLFPLIFSAHTSFAQIRTDSAFVDSIDTRPVTIMSGKLHKTTFDVMLVDTLDEKEDEALFIVGGAVRFNYFSNSWESQQDNRNKLGDMTFDLFRINVSGEMEGVILNAEYRFYSDAFGGAMPHSAWAGYNFNERNMLQLGLHQVPFGNQTYNSDNWFFNITYYLGLEDDYDLGVKYIHSGKKLSYALAFYKNSELPASDFGRYSYDFVGDYEESNQLNGKVTYFLGGHTQVGVSVQRGQIYNRFTEAFGSHTAMALHMRGDYDRLGVKLQFVTLGADIPQDNALADDEAAGDDIITMGAYGAPYNVAYSGQVYTASLSYQVPVSWGPISRLVFYDNYSYYDKTNEAYADTHMNVLGMMLTAGPVYTYIDLASGLNQPWLGPNYENGLAEGQDSAAWHSRFNINFGYYF